MGFLRSIFGLFLFLFVVSCGNNGSPSSAHQAGGISSVENVDTMQADNESVSGDSEVVIENNTNAEIQLLSWNIANLGKSKDDGEIEAMVRVIKDFEVVAIQEVVAGPGGPQAVARLVDALNRRGSKWDYVVSNPTSGGRGVERYAFLWKPSRVKLKGKAWLDTNVANAVDREPFMARFEKSGKTITVASFHAVPQSKYPNAEIELLKDFPKWYNKDHLILVGDFNAGNQEYGGQALLDQGFKDAMNNTKTTIKMKPDQKGNHLANPFDHMYFEQKELQISSKGTVDFTRRYDDLKSARLISDHIPVWASVSVR
jgi:endonuclease/exonuclease/phosphatase family metal-dependent hydrolase